MKFFLTLALISSIALTNAQQNITKSLGSFHTVKAFDLINVKLIKANTNHIEISGDYKHDVTLVNNNGVLKIRMDIDESFNGSNTVVQLYYTTLQTVDANEGAVIELKNELKQPQIEFRAQEGAEISAQLKTETVNVRAVTGGIVNLSGTAKTQFVVINTGGIVNAQSLKTTSTTVKVNAGGEAAINATTLADVKINAGGDVLVYGNPTTVNQKRVFGGSITVVKQQ